VPATHLNSRHSSFLLLNHPNYLRLRETALSHVSTPSKLAQTLNYSEGLRTGQVIPTEYLYRLFDFRYYILGGILESVGHMGDLKSVLYSSVPLVEASSGAENRLIESIVKKNYEQDVTGFLVRTETHYFQYFEGMANTVDRLLPKIERHPYHENMTVLRVDLLEQRRFPRWRMKYYPLNDDIRTYLSKQSVINAKVGQYLLDRMCAEVNQQGSIDFYLEK